MFDSKDIKFLAEDFRNWSERAEANLAKRPERQEVFAGPVLSARAAVQCRNRKPMRILITNDDGSWRGSAQAADSGGPVNGEAHYVGEGAYEGLVMRYYLAGHEGNQAVSGWVTPAE